jgi:hypothetical protein
MGVFSWLDWVRKNITYLKALDNKNISNRANTERLIRLFAPKKQRSTVCEQDLKIDAPRAKFRLNQIN